MSSRLPRQGQRNTWEYTPDREPRGSTTPGPAAGRVVRGGDRSGVLHSLFGRLFSSVSASTITSPYPIVAGSEASMPKAPPVINTDFSVSV
jgi:hypothetical protein